MSKILISVFLVFISLFRIEAFASEEIKIISREEWWANESYRYLNWPEWKDIIEERSKLEKTLTQEEIQLDIKEKAKNNIANNFLITEFPNIFALKSVQKYEGDYKLAWPITKTNTKQSIVIHHTDGNYTDSYSAIRSIYKYHALTNQWWDLGYNYLIWLNWEIFEWRAWWDDVVAAHDKWNNQSSIWIALIWNYDKNDISVSQSESLRKLIDYLIKKYDINVTKKVPFFKQCIWNKSCDQNPINVFYDYPIIGHRDAGYTSCPWEKLYKHLLVMREDLINNSNFSTNLTANKSTTNKIENTLNNINENKLIDFLAKIEEQIDKTDNKENISKLNSIKNIILNVEKEKNLNFSYKDNTSFDDNNKIKVKLSYPLNDKISINFNWKNKPTLKKVWNEYILDFLQSSNLNDYKINLAFDNNKLFFNDKEVNWFSDNNFFRIKSPDDNYLTISSRDRKPNWDKSWAYNDNKFKWDIIIYKKNAKLIVVNELYLSDYLKWLWEVSDSTNKEKIRSIVTLARTYARWYMTKAEKFPWEYYQASDDPNVFQKYLWYWLEQRSPNINKIVDETRDLIITYNWKIIKPWYFSTSDWYTQSFSDYCNNAKWVPDCSNPKKFPFLSKVKDFGWEWKIRNWHWVWVPWTWIEYFSSRGWNYPLIIKYFLKWVEINYL